MSQGKKPISFSCGSVIYNRVGGRKFILGAACLAAEITLLCTGLITAVIFKEMFLITLGITSGVNVAQKIWGKEKVKESSE